MIASDYIGGLVIVLCIVAVWLIGFFCTIRKHDKELKQRSSLEKIAVLLQHEGASITKSEAYTLAFSRLVNVFYLSLDSEMKKYKQEDAYVSFAEKLETNQEFRRRQIAVIMGVIMGMYMLF